MTQAVFEGAGPEQLFRERLAAGELTIQRCEACGAATAQPVVLCPTCGAAALVRNPASGRGIVYSVTVVRSGPGREKPYCVALVDLEEGPRLMSRVEDLAPEDVRIGMAVQAQVVVPPEGEAFHIFRPRETGA